MDEMKYFFSKVAFSSTIQTNSKLIRNTRIFASLGLRIKFWKLKTLWLPGIWEKERHNHHFDCLLSFYYKLGLMSNDIRRYDCSSRFNIATMNMIMTV